MMLVNMGRVFKQTTDRFPDRPALINVERHRRYTYRQMHRLTNKICHMLTGRFGLSKGDRYVTILENDHMGLFHPWMFKSDCTAVWLDVRESPAVILSQIDHVAPRVVFIEAALVPRYYDELHARGLDLVCMDRMEEAPEGVCFFQDLLDDASDGEVSTEFVADDSKRHISLMRFTGGTTGRPKCAAYSLANIWFWGQNPAHYYETFPFSHPRALLFSPINHAASGSVVIPAHLKGGAIITLNKADVERIGQTIALEQAELIYTVPTVLYRMLDTALPEKYNLNSLKTIRYGGASISPSKLEALLEEFGPVFVQGYGSTECWPSVTILAKDEHGTGSEALVRRLASIGRPMPGEEVLICDENDREQAPGDAGEIYIRGLNTISGYYENPEETRLNFTENGFWKSGDIGYRDEEGFIYLIDRKKDMIITGGYNVYAQEVENHLNSHPAVENCAVVGLADETWGEAVVGVVVIKQHQTADPDELIDFCKMGLARYKAPKRIDIVDRLPLSPVGKILRREVKKNLADAS